LPAWAKWVKPCLALSVACTNPAAKAANSVSQAVWLFSAMTVNRRNRQHLLLLLLIPKRLKTLSFNPQHLLHRFSGSAGVCICE
jgi:hypothetical protein